ncbi:hypothetical protein AT6N2_C2166 [Agrobacterium tumefaciens]|nr:hypothetical protein AT6N2_C2166 [Agrobacterium tumefaciens]
MSGNCRSELRPVILRQCIRAARSGAGKGRGRTGRRLGSGRRAHRCSGGAQLLAGLTARNHKTSDERLQRFGLAVQRHAGRRGFFHHRSVLLCDLVHLGNGRVDLLQTDSLLAGGGGDLAYQLVDLQDLIGDPLHRLTSLADQLNTLAHLGGRRVDEPLDLLGGSCGTLRQFTHFLRHDRKAFAGIPGACSLHTGIQREKVCLEGDLVDHPDDTGDFRRRLRNALHGGDGLLHDLARLTGVVAGMADGAGCLCGILRTGIDLCGQLIKCGSGFFEAGGLLFRAMREIASCAGDLARAVANADDGGVDRGNRFLEAGERRVEILPQLCVFAGELLLNAVGQIALRQSIQTGAENADDVLLHAAVFIALEFRALAFRLGVTTLGVGFCLHLTNARELGAETFKRSRNRTRFILTVLTGNSHIVTTVAERPDVCDERRKRVTNEIADGKIKRCDDGGKNDDRADDHQISLLLDRCIQGLMGNIDKNDPGGVKTRNGEWENETVVRRVGIEPEIFDETLLAGGNRGLDRGCAFSVIGFHILLGRRRNQPLAALRNERHPTGFERMQGLQLLGKRCERNIDTCHADHLSIRHDGIGKRRHRGRHFRALRKIRLRDRALTGFGCERIPFRSVVIIKSRVLNIALLCLGPVRGKRAFRIGSEIQPARNLRRLAIEKAELLAEPATEGEGVLFDIRLEDVDDARAIHRFCLMRPADHTRHGARRAAEFADIRGDDIGDGPGFRIGLIHGQRMDALACLEDEEGIGCNENRGNGTAGHEDEFGRERLHFEIEHFGPNGDRQPERADVNG